MKCDELAEKLTELMEGALDESEEAVALEHLASCRRCETVLAETRDVVDLARDHGQVSLSDADRDRMLSKLLGGVGDSAAE